jgi:hypothetical protein
MKETVLEEMDITSSLKIKREYEALGFYEHTGRTEQKLEKNM